VSHSAAAAVRTEQTLPVGATVSHSAAAAVRTEQTLPV